MPSAVRVLLVVALALQAALGSVGASLGVCHGRVLLGAHRAAAAHDPCESACHCACDHGTDGGEVKGDRREGPPPAGAALVAAECEACFTIDLDGSVSPCEGATPLEHASVRVPCAPILEPEPERTPRIAGTRRAPPRLGAPPAALLPGVRPLRI